MVGEEARRQLHKNAILNKSWWQHPTRHQLYGHLPPITKTIQGRWSRHAGHCWRSKDELISDVLLWTPAYGQAKAGRPARTYIQQLCEDMGCSPEDLPEAMNDTWTLDYIVLNYCLLDTTCFTNAEDYFTSHQVRWLKADCSKHLYTTEPMSWKKSVRTRLYEAGQHGRFAFKKPLLWKQNDVKRLQWVKVHKDRTISSEIKFLDRQIKVPNL